MKCDDLDHLVRASLQRLVDDLNHAPWVGRERELVSLFVFEHLLDEGSRLNPPLRPGQVGIEVAVPQHPPHGGRRRQPNVCKDVVIWPETRMTTWGPDQQELRYPLAVLEWKSFNNVGTLERHNSKRAEIERDREWLRVATGRSSMRGYLISTNLAEMRRSIACLLVAGGVAQEHWIIE